MANIAEWAQQPLAAFTAWAVRSPEFAKLCARYAGDVARLWTSALARERGRDPVALIVPAPGDRRFAAPEWRDNPFYDFIHQSYLLQARFMRDVVDAAEMDAPLRGQLRFLVRQATDALSPANFVATNPEVLRHALETNGESLRSGLRNMLADVERGRISTVDESAFEIGGNLAVTPGAVVYENELMQLLQYRPTTPHVHARPLLMVPPCINKFYILDLRAENSLVRYAVEAGHTVFMVSWRNPSTECVELAQWGWDDYIEDGVVRAIDTALAIARSDRLNALGFCVGGTLLATGLAVLAARGRRCAASLTLLATLLDYSDTGEIGCFVSEASVSARKAALASGGMLTGRELSGVFSALRDNDLIWPYVVNNYLKGGMPAAFDILYWNADSTNLPGPMYSWYLCNLYLHNRLRSPGALAVRGTPIDLSRLRIPAYIVGTREDHIVPWKTAFQSTQLIGDGKTVRFVLGASGHVVGIINPANANRRSFWASGREGVPAQPDVWLASATERQGSWWGDWSNWLRAHGGPLQRKPSRLGSTRFKPIELAPGRYVKSRIM